MDVNEKEKSEQLLHLKLLRTYHNCILLLNLFFTSDARTSASINRNLRNKDTLPYSYSFSRVCNFANIRELYFASINFLDSRKEREQKCI